VVFGICFGTPVNPPPRPLYSENSTYTLPPGTAAGDIITISFIANSGGIFGNCDNIEDTMRIHVLVDPVATFSVANTLCQGDNVVVTGTPNTTVSYSVNGSPAGTFAIGASGTTTFNNLAAGTYTLTSINYTNLPNSAGVGCTKPISGQTV